MQSGVRAAIAAKYRYDLEVLLVSPTSWCHTGHVAKVSVSIPDELLDRARALHGPSSTSQLVQQGLMQLTAHLTRSSIPDYAQRPDDAQDLLAPARDKLLAAARKQFEQGYRAGIEDIGELDWKLLEELADARFDLLTRLSAWQRSLTPDPSGDMTFRPPGWFDVLAKRFGSLVDPIGFDKFGFAPSRTFVRGYAAALRDAWATVEPDQVEQPTEVEPDSAAVD